MICANHLNSLDPSLSFMVKPAKTSSSVSDVSKISLDLPEANFTRKMKLKNAGKIKNRTQGVEFGLNRKLNLCTSRFITSQYPLEFGFLVTANEMVPSVTECMIIIIVIIIIII